MHGAVEFSGDNWVTKLAAEGTSTPAADVWSNAPATNDGENLNSLGDWEIDAATIGVFNAHGSPLLVKTATGWSSGSTIYPADTATNASIEATVTGTLTDTLNDDTHGTTGMEGSKLTHAASAHYMVHSFVKYWNGATITWTLTNSSAMF